MDEVWTLVERAISIADIVEAHDPTKRSVARTSLVNLAETIRETEPDHPALRRLDDYLEEYGP